MGFFKELFNGLKEISEREALYAQWEQLKELKGSPGMDGPDYDMEYYREHGELPSQKRLREFEEKHGLREKS